MPTPLDIAFVILFAVVVTAIETFVFFPRFKASVAAGKPHARRHGYRRTIAGQWLFALAGVALWAASGRSWTQLGLVPPTDARIAASIAIVAIMAFLALRQTRAITRLAPEAREQLRTRFAGLDFLLPHTRDEYRWFTALSWTAGICEELLYRGYLMWVLQAYLGLAGAVAASAVLFAVGHSYQGRKGVLKVAVVALVMSTIVLVTGWLIPAMVVHALVDASAGIAGFTVLRPAEVLKGDS